MPLYLPATCIKGIESVILSRHNHCSIDHEWLSIDRSVEWLLPEVCEAGRSRHACDKPGTRVVLVVGGPIATGHLSRRRSHSVSGKCQGRDLHRLRRWDMQGLEEQVYLVT